MCVFTLKEKKNEEKRKIAFLTFFFSLNSKSSFLKGQMPYRIVSLHFFECYKRIRLNGFNLNKDDPCSKINYKWKRMCEDYRDLNKATLKDVHVDNTAGHTIFFFMVGF